MTDKPETHAIVVPVEGVSLYTGFGHAPFAPGTPLRLPIAHAQALLDAGMVAHPAAPRAIPDASDDHPTIAA